MDFLRTWFGDWAGSAILAIGGFAYRHTIAKVVRYSADLMRRFVMLANKGWYHNVAVQVRGLLWWTLTICLTALVVCGAWAGGATLLHLLETVGDLTYGTPAFWPRIAGTVIGVIVALVALAVAIIFDVIFISIAILRLWPVRAIPGDDLRALFDGLPEEPEEPVDPGPTATAAQQAAYQQAMVDYQPIFAAFQTAWIQAETRILQILRDAGPSERLGTFSFLALILPFVVSGVACGIACGSLYTWIDMPWHYSLLVGVIAVCLIVLGCLAALFVMFILAKTIEVAGATVNWFLKVVVRQGAVALPGIVEGNVDRIVGEIKGLPTGPASTWIKDVLVGPISGTLMLGVFFLFWPDLRVVLIFLAIQLARGIMQFILERYGKLDMLARLQKSLQFFDGIVLMLLIVGRSAVAIGKFAFKWTSSDVQSTLQTLIGWVQGIINLHWGHGFWIIPGFALTAWILFAIGNKVEKKTSKAVIRSVAAVFGLIPLLLMIGCLTQAVTGQRTNQIRAFGLQGPPVPTATASGGSSATNQPAASSSVAEMNAAQARARAAATSASAPSGAFQPTFSYPPSAPPR